MSNTDSNMDTKTDAGSDAKTDASTVIKTEIANTDTGIEIAQGATEPSPRSRSIRYAAISFAFYITLSLGSYVTVFLQSIGFNAQGVGIITSLNSGVGVFSSPFWGMLSDKLRSLKKVITITYVVGVVLFALIPITSSINLGAVSFVFLLIPFTMFFKMPTMSLLENWMIRNTSREKLNYGAIRSVGSFSYAAVSFLLGYVLPKTGVRFTFYANALLSIPALFLLHHVKGGTDEATGMKRSLTFKEMQFSRIFKSYHYVTYVVFSVFQRIPFHCAMVFLPFLVAEIGGNTAQMGIILGMRAFLEIPMMLLLKPLRQKVPLYYLIFAASGFYMIECILYSFSTSFIVIVAISVFHGLGNGLMIPSGSSYVFMLTPEELKATSQTVLASMNAIAGILGGLLGGYFIMRLGIKQFYFVVGLLILAALILYMSSFVIGEKVFGIKRPGLSVH